jgi:hypothetical protein
VLSFFTQFGLNFVAGGRMDKRSGGWDEAAVLVQVPMKTKFSALNSLSAHFSSALRSFLMLHSA